MSVLQSIVIFLTLSSLSTLTSPHANPPINALIEGTTGNISKNGLSDCWNALLELRPCMDDIVLFFMNGETYLARDCCKAIRMTTLTCWPSMLASIGFTSDEVDILKNYCGAAGIASPPFIHF